MVGEATLLFRESLTLLRDYCDIALRMPRVLQRTKVSGTKVGMGTVAERQSDDGSA